MSPISESNNQGGPAIGIQTEKHDASLAAGSRKRHPAVSHPRGTTRSTQHAESLHNSLPNNGDLRKLEIKSSKKLAKRLRKRLGKEHRAKKLTQKKGLPPKHGGPSSNFDYDSEFYSEASRETLIGTEVPVPLDPEVPVPLDPNSLSLPGPWEQIRSNAQEILGATMADEVVNHVERLLLFSYKLSADTTFQQALATCGMYLKYYVNGSLLVTTYSYITNFCSADLGDTSRTIGDRYAAEAGLYRSEADPGQPGIFPVVWEGLKNAPFARKLVYILGTVSAIAACKINDVQINHTLIDEFSKARAAENLNAFDLIDAVISTYHWVSTIGLQCLRERSLDPMNLSTSQLHKIQARYIYWYNQKSILFSSEKPANADAMRTEMFTELRSMIDECHKILKYKAGGSTSVLANTVVKPIIDFYEACRKLDTNVDFVKAAQGYLLWGPPGVGKSSMIPHICTCIALGLKRQYNPKYASTINLADKYQDKLTNETETIHIDEIAPVKTEFNTAINPAVVLSLALVGNQPFQPVRSDVESKAAIVCKHYAATMAANDETPLLKLMTEPGAYFRRYMCIHVDIRDEYRNSMGRLDDDHPDFENDDYPDAWVFGVYELSIDSSGRKQRHYLRFDYGNHKDRVAKDIGIRELEQLIIQRSVTHGKKEAEKLLKNFEKKNMGNCLKCSTLRGCKCNPKDSCSVISEDTYTPPRKGDSVLTSMTDYVPPVVVRNPFETSGDVTLPQFGPPVFNDPPQFGNAFNNFPGHTEQGLAPFKAESGLAETLARACFRAAKASISRWLTPLEWFNSILSLDSKVVGMLDHELLQEVNHVTDWMMAHAIAVVPGVIAEHRFFNYFKEKLMWAVAAQDQKIVPVKTMVRKSVSFGLVSTGVTYSYLRCFPESWYSFQLSRLGQYMVTPRPRFVKHISLMSPTRRFFSEICEKIPKLPTAPSIVPPINPVIKYALPTAITIGAIATCGYYGVQLFRATLGAPARYAEIQRKIDACPNIQRALWAKARSRPDEYQPGLVAAAGASGVILAGLLLWNAWRKNNPEAADGEVRKPSWFQSFSIFSNDPPVSAEKKNRPSDHCVSKTKSNVVVIKDNLTGQTCRSTILCSNIFEMPCHFFHEDFDLNKPWFESKDITINWVDSNPLKVRVYRNNVVQVGMKDLVLLYISKCPPSKDLTSMLLKSDFNGSCTANLVLNVNNKIISEKVCAVQRENIKTEHITIPNGYVYSSSYTREGMCGTPIIADRTDGAIIGFHVAGRPLTFSSKREGVCVSLTLPEFEIAREELLLQNPVVLGAQSSPVDTKLMGAEVYAPGPAHPKATVFHDGSVGTTGNVVALGQCPLRAKPVSKIKRSLIADAIDEVYGKQVEYGPPKFDPPYIQYNRAILAVEEGALDMDPELLRLAVDDYLRPILAMAEKWVGKHPTWCKPLTFDQAINGIPDRDHIKSLEMKTSIGLPSLGRKDKYFTGTQVSPDVPKTWTAPPEIIEEYNRIVAHYMNNERANTFSYACFKDEAVKVTKDKCRIIYVQEAAFTILLRQYFLPLIEFRHNHPHLTECAVGVNCAGPDWEEMMIYVLKYGGENAFQAADVMGFGLDYKNFDLCRPANVTSASMKMMLDIAKVFGYDSQSIQIMSAMISDLVNPLVSWNGTLVRMWMWISGNSLTVDVNSSDNSLFVRCCYFDSLRAMGCVRNGALHPVNKGDSDLFDFRSNVAITTYGDDLFGTVLERARRLLSFCIFRDFLRGVGMTVTTPDKKDTDLGFWPVKDLDFLKRKSVFIPELSCRVGALDKEAIYRQMQYCSCTSEPGEMQDDAVDAVGSALREFFLYGREEYDQQRVKLRLVCEANNIHSKDLDVDFDARVLQWQESNLPS
jgi:hypothetical protein